MNMIEKTTLLSSGVALISFAVSLAEQGKYELAVLIAIVGVLAIATAIYLIEMQAAKRAIEEMS